MTDKQITFDDVDVKDCIAYAKSQEIYLGNTLYKQMEKVCMVKNQPCKFFDCQFKQMARELKAKEQECEDLKIYIESNEQQVKEVEKLVMDNDRLINELDQLKQTLTEIKEIACRLPIGVTREQILQKISEVEE